VEYHRVFSLLGVRRSQSISCNKQHQVPFLINGHVTYDPLPDEQKAYITIESRWVPTECPSCKRVATAHGWLFRESPPRAPRADNRKPIGEVFMHPDAKDCTVRHGGTDSGSGPFLAEDA
jgi:hypothetical protein